MADRYLLEGLPATSDGYLLEDGSGVLILDCNAGFQYDAFQSPGFQSCPYVTPAVSAYQSTDEVQQLPVDDPSIQSYAIQPPVVVAFDPANGFPWNQDAGESFVQPQLWPDSTTDLLYAFGPPQNAVAGQSWNLDDGERFVVSQVVPDTTELVAGYVPPTLQAWSIDGVEVQAQPDVDPSVQSWAVGTPLNAVIAQAFNTPDEASAQPVDDPSIQSYAIQPPAVTTVAQLTAFSVDTEDEVQAVPTADDTPQAWAVQPPLNAIRAQAFNTSDEARVEPVDDPSVQSWAVQPPAAATVSALTAFTVDTEDEVQAQTTQDDTPQAWSITPPQNAVAALVFNQPQDEPYTTVEDPTVPTYAVQPPAYIPVFQVTAWPVDGGEVQSAPTPDDSVQAWAVGTPQNAIALVAFNGDSEVTQAVSVDDLSVQSWAVQPLFDPSTVTWTGRDDIVQPVWAIADDAAQAWTIVPPVPFIGNIADEPVIPAWMIPDDTTLGAWAATNGSTTVVTGGPGPNSGGATASVPSGSAFVPVPGGSAISPVPSGSASSPTPQR